jgi:hypothetical protein
VSTSALGAPAPLSRAVTALTRPVVAGVLLFAIYGALSLAIVPGGFSAADTGGKVATLHVMVDQGTLTPSVGYWAATADPTGALHPLASTGRVGSNWAQITTVPMVVAAYPLDALGGDRALLVLPMLGAVLVAFAARALARRLGARTGWPAFWVVGLATPVTLYALSFWEHTLGLAAMLWAVVLLFDVVQRAAGWRGALAAGLLFGAAATMRTEALAYFAVAVAVGAITVVVRERNWPRAFTTACAMGAGLVVALVAEYAFEVALFGHSLRESRVAGTASASGASLLDRARDAATTLVGLNAYRNPVDWIVGGLFVAALFGGAWCFLRRDPERPLGIVLLSLAALLLVSRGAAGLGFVPGLLTASPIAAVGAVAIWMRPSPRWLAAFAWCSLPIVWATEFVGGASPQWGGRYLLLPGALFAVVATVVLARRPAVLAAVVALSVAVTAFGFVYLADRTRTVDQGMREVLARHDAAVVSLDPQLFREGGAYYDPHAHWLTATTPDEFRRAVAIIRGAGDRELTALVPVGTPAPSAPGYRRGSRTRITVRPDLTVEAVRYHAE